jgi:hypothetical protein
MKMLRQGTAITVVVGPFLDKADGLTPLAAVSDQSANGSLVKNGTGGAITAASWAHIANGHYAVGLSTAHTDTVGRLRLSFSLAGTYCPVWEDWEVLPQAVYDALIAGSANLPASVAAYATGQDPAAQLASQFAALPSASSNGAAAATAILATPGNKISTDSGGRVMSDVTEWKDGAVPTPSTTGVPITEASKAVTYATTFSVTSGGAAVKGEALSVRNAAGPVATVYTGASGTAVVELKVGSYSVVPLFHQAAAVNFTVTGAATVSVAI